MSGVAPGSMRVSDLDRIEVTNLLCRHYADGRLTEDEFHERTGKAAAAKTRDDLSPLVVDLPPLDVPPPPGPPQLSGPAPLPRPFQHHHSILRVVFLVFLAMWVLGATQAMLGMRFLFVPWPLIIVAFIVLRATRHHRHHWH